MNRQSEREWWDAYYRRQGWREIAPGWWMPPPDPLGDRVAGVLPYVLIAAFIVFVIGVVLWG